MKFLNKLYFVSLQSVLQQATTLMAGDSKEKNDEGKKNLLLTTLQVGFDFNHYLIVNNVFQCMIFEKLIKMISVA